VALRNRPRFKRTEGSNPLKKSKGGVSLGLAVLTGSPPKGLGNHRTEKVWREIREQAPDQKVSCFVEKPGASREGFGLLRSPMSVGETDWKGGADTTGKGTHRLKKDPKKKEKWHGIFSKAKVYGEPENLDYWGQ